MVSLVSWPLILAALGGCGREGTAGQALEALEQAQRSTAYQSLTDPQADVTGDAVEVSVDSTIGDRAKAAVEDLLAFWESQAACSTVSATGKVVTVDYGDLSDGCTWKGRTYGGVHAMAIDGVEDTLAVDHTFTGFTDGTTAVDGGIDVTWSAGDQTRRAVTDLVFAIDGEPVEVQGDHTYGLLVPALGWLGGLTLDGTRAWFDPAGGRWDLSMDEIELRWIDPVPQAGVYRLTTPDDVAFTLTFSRQSDLVIRATLDGPTRSWAFDVSLAGAELVDE